MAHADNHTVFRTISNQLKIFIVFRAYGHIFYPALCRILIHFKLFYRRLRNRFRRLRSLIGHIQIRPLKMYTKDFSALVAFFNNSGHICHSLCENIRHLCHRCRQNRGDALFRNPFHPVPQPGRFTIICIKAIGTVGMNIDKARKNRPLTIIFLRRLLTVSIDSLNFIF